jgi:hypothetical protein
MARSRRRRSVHTGRLIPDPAEIMTTESDLYGRVYQFATVSTVLTDVDRFLDVSARLTGFTRDELRTTRLVEQYHVVLLEEIGSARFDAFAAAVATAGDQVTLHDPEALALARRLTQLWYTGVWCPDGAPPFVVSRRAYAEGLVWKTFNGSPPGTAAPGFGSWSSAPRLPAVPGEAA